MENAFFIVLLVLVFFFSVTALVGGIRGIKVSKTFAEDKKLAKIAYFLLSIIQLIAGAIIVICYIFAVLLRLSNI